MEISCKSIIGWVGVAGAALLLAACGGGGGGGDSTTTPTTPAPVADARNGDYTMVAANAQEYTLSLNFDASTYHLGGTNVDQSGSFTGSGSNFNFLPSNATGASGIDTTRFSIADDTVVGDMSIGGGVVPFVAPRSFATTLTDTVGVYNLMGRLVNTAGGTPDNNFQQAEITADGHLRTCDDSVIYTMSNCPAASVTTGTLTVTGTQFRSDTPNGAILFRVAHVGADKVLLRASASSGTTRRFWLGTPATTSFAAGTFAGGDTGANWDVISLTPASSTATGTQTTPAGASTPFTATANGLAVGNGLASMLGLTASNGGNYFATRVTDFGAIFAARGSTVAPGFVAIGRAQ